MKKTFVTLALIAALLVPGLSFAYTGLEASGSSSSVALDPSALDCMLMAVTTRQTTINAAQAAYAITMASLMLTAADIAAFKATSPTADDAKAFWKAYWKKYKETDKTAKKKLNDAKKAAWATFKVSAKECKGVPSDASYQSIEVAK